MRARKLTAGSLAALLLTLILAGGALAGYEDIEGEVQEIVLDNGLKILLLERHEVPVFSFWTYVNVGGADEVTNLTGLAHMFEHMAFKGTQTVGTFDYKKEAKLFEKMDAVYLELRDERWKGEAADAERIAELEAEFTALQEQANELVDANAFGRVVESNGGVGMNAMTSADATQYFYSMPSNKLEVWAALESDRYTNPVLREFYKERNVIVEERRMRTESNPQGRLFEEFLALAYLGHSYGQPTIGHRSDIEAYSRIDAYEFYERHYGAKNMVIAVVGDVYYDELKKLAEKYFAEIPPGNGGIHVRTVDPEQLGERRVVLEDPAQPFLMIGYHIPDARHEDMPAVSALADILGQGRSSRLYSSLVKESQSSLFTGCFAGLPGDRYPSLLIALGVPNAGVDILDMEQDIYDEIELIKSEGVTAEELAGYKNRARAEFIQGLRGMMGMSGNIAIAAQLCYAEMVLGDWRELFRALDDIEAVTLEDVQRVANEYLVKSNRSVGMIVTENQDS